jgi:hypothetical protein
MSSIIKIKRSLTQGSVPSEGSLELGEIAVNLFDRKLYVGNTYNEGATAGVSTIGGEDYRLTTKNATSGEGVYLRLLGDSILSTNNVLLQPGEGVDVVRQSNGSITISGEDATASNKGVASFNSDSFDVTGGAVSLADSASGAVLSINGTTDEVEVSRTNGTVTVGLPDDVTITGQLNIGENAVIVGNTQIGGDLTVDGDLTVEGGVTYISSSTVNVDDSMLKLSANNVADTVDHGVYAKYVDGVTTKYAGYFRDSSDGSIFKFYKGLEAEPTTTVNVGGTGYTLATIEAVIDGGTY